MLLIGLPLLFIVRTLNARLTPSLPSAPVWLSLAFLFIALIVPLTLVALLARRSDFWPWK